MGNCSLNRAVFLDRDGVINEVQLRNGRPYPPDSFEDLKIFKDVPESLKKLKTLGFQLIVVTNQPDVGRGTQKKEIVECINDYLLKELNIDAFYVCWHGYDGECNCRKPLPGLLLKAAKERKIDLKQSFMIGDRWRDIDAGHAAGCRTIFIDRNYEESLQIHPEITLESISEASDWVQVQAN